MEKLLIFLLIVFIPLSSFSQTTFFKSFGGTSADVSYGLTQATDGGFYVTGRTTSFGNGQLEAYVMRLDSLGNLIWSRTLGLSGSDNFGGAIATPDNGVIAVGNYTDGDTDALAAKFDSSGNLVWTKLYGNIGTDGFIHISETTSGEYLISGVSSSQNPGGLQDALIIKINGNNGNIVWSRTLGGFQNDWIREIKENANGNIYAVGNTFSYGSGQHDGMILNISPQGVITNLSVLGTSQDENLWQMTVMPNADAVASGYATISGKRQIWLLRTDELGNIAWNKTYGIGGISVGGRVELAKDGNLVVFAYETGNANTATMFILKINAQSGNIMWAKEYGGNQSDFFGGFGVAKDGSLIASGGTKSYGAGDSDIFIFKAASDGVIRNCSYQDVTSQFSTSNFTPNITSPTPTEQVNFPSSNKNITLSNPSVIQTSVCEETITANFQISQDTICAGETIQLTNLSINANNYQWTLTGTGLSTSTQTNLNNLQYNSSGIYTIELIASNTVGSDTATQQIVVSPSPSVDLGNDTVFCDVANWLLDATTPNVSYLWQDGSSQPIFNASSSGNYTVTITNSEGCSSSSSVNLTFDFTPNIDLGNDTIICEGNSLQLDASSPQGSAYLWQDGSSQPIFNANESGNYTVTVTSGICQAEDSIAVLILDAPPIQLGIDTFLCNNSDLILDVYSDLAVQYLWQDGSSQPTFSVTEAGVYTVEVNYISGCTNTDTIEFFEEPDIELNLIGDTTFCIGTPITLNAYHEAAKSYQWTGQSAYYGQNDYSSPIFTITFGGEYSVQINNGCRDTLYQIQAVVEDCSCLPFVPNAFSPNNDGFNDIFKVYAPCPIENFSMKIFDRWGDFLFETNDIEQGWDGFARGERLTSNVFVWVIEYTAFGKNGLNERKLDSGSVTLVR